MEAIIPLKRCTILFPSEIYSSPPPKKNIKPYTLHKFLDTLIRATSFADTFEYLKKTLFKNSFDLEVLWKSGIPLTISEDTLLNYFLWSWILSSIISTLHMHTLDSSNITFLYIKKGCNLKKHIYLSISQHAFIRFLWS